MSNSLSGKKIHIVSTVNGQVNEGMRNVATHIAKALEKDNEVRYSGLKNIGSIIKNSFFCDVTIVFARANKLVYWLCRLISLFSRNLWIVCVQKPDNDFTALAGRHPLKANYLTLSENDLAGINPGNGCRKETFNVGIKADKFSPVDKKRQNELKLKYGFDPDRILVIHVGHCSAGRGLEDFAAITDAARMVVASGMFENAETVKTLNDAGVKIHNGYMEHVEEIYQMADVYLFPTRSAEFVISVPLSVMEALSCGVPVIGYKDFANLSDIPAEEDAVSLIDDKSELDAAVTKAAAKKRDKSYLKVSRTWEQVASDVLNIVGRN